jgi:hypothetical protein
MLLSLMTPQALYHWMKRGTLPRFSTAFCQASGSNLTGTREQSALYLDRFWKRSGAVLFLCLRGEWRWKDMFFAVRGFGRVCLRQNLHLEGQ